METLTSVSIETLLANWSSQYILSRWIFFRLLGVIFAIAFASLAVQLLALVGSRGILSAKNYLDAVREHYGKRAYRLLPTLFWWKSSDRTLLTVAWVGFAVSLGIFLGVLELPCLLIAVIAYLSLTVVGQDFLSFQWDVLLIETGFFALFIAPLNGFTGTEAAALVPPIGLFLLWWLLFRLMFESGAVKLSCGDETWRELSALDIHYQTQPLPHRGAWYAHHLPKWFQRFSVLLVFGIELILPFFFFAPAPLRLFAVSGTVFLMLLIFLTGNYNFFNLLTLALCVLLVDDGVWSRILPAVLLPSEGNPSPGTLPFSWIIHSLIALLVFLISIPQLLRSVFPALPWPLFITRLQASISPFHLINSYGLFRNMTVTRPEIVIEGSMDGQDWQAYEFRYKPGDLGIAPRWIQPHQPRLDWQMWFAALRPIQATPWVQGLLYRLFEGSEPVLKLFKKLPFSSPPRYIRAQLYDYQFTTAREKKESGNWWKRTLLKPFSPTLMRR